MSIPNQETKDTLISELVSAQCIKYGHFVLKSGATSSYYVNLRETTMHLNLFRHIVDSIKTLIENFLLDSTTSKPLAIVGVPYGVVPVAAAAAFATNLPYYPIRKETKEYGYKPDDNSYADHSYIMIEDVMSTGSSIIETLEKMKNKKITDVIVIVNREMGGDERLKAEYPHLRLHSILRISDFSNLAKSQ